MGLKQSKHRDRPRSKQRGGPSTSVDPQDHPNYQKRSHGGETSSQGNYGKHNNSTPSPNAETPATETNVVNQPLIKCESQSPLANSPSRSVGISDEIRASNDFPFLVDQPSVDYIRSAKVMFIMRGLSGSGKSTIVGLLKETYSGGVSCSADDFFMVNGVYQFDRHKLSNAHSTCQGKAEAACQQNTCVVIIDNTNVRRWEMNAYHTVATRWQYNVVHVIPRTPWRFDAAELARRNKHGVSEDILVQKTLHLSRCVTCIVVRAPAATPSSTAPPSLRVEAELPAVKNTTPAKLFRTLWARLSK